MTGVVERVTWAEVEEVLARVEEALGVDDANLLRAALGLRRVGVESEDWPYFSDWAQLRKWGEISAGNRD